MTDLTQHANRLRLQLLESIDKAEVFVSTVDDLLTDNPPLVDILHESRAAELNRITDVRGLLGQLDVAFPVTPSHAVAA